MTRHFALLASRVRCCFWAVIFLSLGCGGATIAQTTPLHFASCGDFECARAAVPYDWNCADSDCNSRAVNLLVRRYQAPSPSRGQLWALDGGPGFSGEGFFDPGFVELVHAAGFDLYVPTHRGTPGSDALACPAAEAPDSPGGGRITQEELPACRALLEREWGSLTHFSSMAAGRDVAHLLTLAPASERTVVFGGSYGTLWGQRVLQAAPAGAIDLAWFDSVVDLEATLENADQHADIAARTLFAQCQASGVCPIEIDEALSVLAAHDDGEGCGGLDGAVIRALGYRLLSGNIQERLVYVHLLARSQRCEPQDEVALAHAVEHFQNPAAAPGVGLPYAPLLNLHMIAAELDGGLAPSNQRSLLASRAGDEPLRARLDAWGVERLPLDTTSTTDARVILWSGGLDPLDPPSWAARTAERWDAELITVPSAGHALMRYARTGTGNCAHTIWTTLLADPSAEVDRSCLADIVSVDWAVENEATRESLETWLGAP